MYETKTGWWDDGWFHLPISEKRSDGLNYPTGYMFDASPCSSVHQDFRAATLKYANRVGLEAAAASSGGWMFKDGERPRTMGRITGVPIG